MPEYVVNMKSGEQFRVRASDPIEARQKVRAKLGQREIAGTSKIPHDQRASTYAPNARTLGR